MDAYTIITVFRDIITVDGKLILICRQPTNEPVLYVGRIELIYYSLVCLFDVGGRRDRCFVFCGVHQSSRHTLIKTAKWCVRILSDCVISALNWEED